MENEKPGKGNDKPGSPGGGNGPKPVTIFVNTIAHQVAKDDISYEDVVHLAYPEGHGGQNPGYTVLYERANGNKAGSLGPGQSVKAKDGMIFDVTPTNLS
ncbi:multiubiquitin domain-containing protein [Aquihabitans sp. G128]|jgi:hypothetical protein|uniref:multiubiquitin domain-containing protein n=1 Tax=Aquihabitans sp. G128 TaxID=2849779 RepID=UPI001C244E0C|nr:multiubiquitin domain-containing protein [Aquihabitans sp. G128]QXC60497.1 multiubiquitin domain-containing protein [Aquihabitans sp. G128]HWJ63701.1 multiubiquitin domain-containing protein [Acidimicrobiales bacterium]